MNTPQTKETSKSVAPVAITPESNIFSGMRQTQSPFSPPSSNSSKVVWGRVLTPENSKSQLKQLTGLRFGVDGNNGDVKLGGSWFELQRKREEEVRGRGGSEGGGFGGVGKVGGVRRNIRFTHNLSCPSVSDSPPGEAQGRCF